MAGRGGPTPTGDIAERVLAGAERCFERYGVAKTSVEDVARAAGVSRKTVYRYFDGGRDEIVLTVLLRRSAAQYVRIQALIDAEPDVPEALCVGIVETIRSIRSDEHLALLFAADDAGRTAALAGRSEAVFAATRALVAQLFERARTEGSLRDGANADDATEWVLRIVVSFVTVDVGAPRTDDELRELLRRCLVPAFFGEGSEGANGASGESSQSTRRRR